MARPYAPMQTKASRKRAAPYRFRLVVMVKAPVAGAVKTRLARDLGVAAACRFARHTAAAVLQRVAGDPRWQTVLAVAPDAALAARWWDRGLPRMGQGSGDLGRRMASLIRAMPPGPVVIVGSDIPNITPAPLASAFRELSRHQAVFGPAEDGGYLLVGLNWRARAVAAFVGVRWSSRHALADTVANLRGRSVAYVENLVDVDDREALVKHSGRLGRRIANPCR